MTAKKEGVLDVERTRRLWDLAALTAGPAAPHGAPIPPIADPFAEARACLDAASERIRALYDARTIAKKIAPFVARVNGAIDALERSFDEPGLDELRDATCTLEDVCEALLLARGLSDGAR